MTPNKIYIGTNEARFSELKVQGEYLKLDEEYYYKISNSNAMRPFFMSIVSDSNHWMFISSNGGLSAGRKDSESSLFPYYTDDKITASAEFTGSKTLLHVHLRNKSYLWEPFSERYEGLYRIRRNLYKNNYGNKILFEEINEDLGISLRYQWVSSNLFGFVKKTWLLNLSREAKKVALLDGIQNILPYGVNTDLQNNRSNLVDAYKRNQLHLETGLGIFTLSAIIVDKAEPSEALSATVAWSLGIEDPKYLVSSLQLDAFRRGNPLIPEIDIKGEKGAYFVYSDMQLGAGEEKNWMIVANVNQGPSAVVNLSQQLKKGYKNLYKEIEQDIDLGTRQLIHLAAAADGLQISEDKLRTVRHYSNVLYNIMRGGIFDSNYDIDKKDFVTYLRRANKEVWERNKNVISNLNEIFSLNTLKTTLNQIEDKGFKRLSLEYMPLKFSRRHGDPSRPWNKFSINTKSELDGSKILDYEGNWRDIFQNWEALALSYPEFIDGMIHKFFNATTFEGYNPYRITKGGFDWEVIEPDDPWSYIGYWGDHQIVYLLKFLEFIEKYYPGTLAGYLDRELFVYANVPYKIKSYQDTLKEPKDTIDYDHELAEEIGQRKIKLGADGTLITDQNSDIYHINLIEKLLATVLAKCSNFIPEAGIWLNTQRPEWNDANNALVGNGVSMVTLYYLRRFLKFFQQIISRTSMEKVAISGELALFFNGIHSTFKKFESSLTAKISDVIRKSILDGLGSAGSEYRTRIYAHGFSGKRENVTKSDLLDFIVITLRYLDHAIQANERADRMYHSYNLMEVKSQQEISVSYLSEMLEGQVAVLSSGYLSSEACLDLLDSLKKSALYRKDQFSYLLYPAKNLPGFLSKNDIPLESVEKSALLRQLIKDDNRMVIEMDVLGRYHFKGTFNNVNSLKKALSSLPSEKYAHLVEKEKDLVLAIFEEVFDHKSFTGRSGTFYGYEGLGSIYWHMVSKLLLAVQECCLKAIERDEGKTIVSRLFTHYHEINQGIGVHKSPDLYGAFPIDPYSHTPAYKGAQQPGMTGQVKEDILSRYGELGVFVRGGQLGFSTGLLNKREFLKKGAVFQYVGVDSNTTEIALDKNSLCFTQCQVPVVYKLSNENSLQVAYKDKRLKESDSLLLDVKTSAQIFGRTGEIEQITVNLNRDEFLA